MEIFFSILIIAALILGAGYFYSESTNLNQQLQETALIAQQKTSENGQLTQRWEEAKGELEVCTNSYGALSGSYTEIQQALVDARTKNAALQQEVDRLNAIVNGSEQPGNEAQSSVQSVQVAVDTSTKKPVDTVHANGFSSASMVPNSSEGISDRMLMIIAVTICVLTSLFNICYFMWKNRSELYRDHENISAQRNPNETWVRMSRQEAIRYGKTRSISR